MNTFVTLPHRCLLLLLLTALSVPVTTACGGDAPYPAGEHPTLAVKPEDKAITSNAQNALIIEPAPKALLETNCCIGNFANFH